MQDITTQSVPDTISYAQQAFNAGDMAEAGKLYQQALQQQPRNHAVLTGMASVCMEVKDFQGAVTYGSKAVAVAPDQLQAYLLMGDALLHLKEHHKAAVCYCLAISKGYKPQECFDHLVQYSLKAILYKDAVAALHCIMGIYADAKKHQIYGALGYLHTEGCDLEAARDAYELAMQQGQYASVMMHYYMNILAYLEEYGAMKHCLRTIKSQGADDNTFFIAAVSYMRFVYTQENVEECFHVKKQLAGISFTPINIKDCPLDIGLSTGIYCNYILALMDIYKNRDVSDNRAGNIMYVVGDSHCLATVGTTVVLNGKRYRCKAKLMVGSQARRFAQPEYNIFKHLLSDYMCRIPKHSTVMLMFGDLDCTANAGIYRYLTKCGKLDEPTIIETARSTINDYVEYCIKIAEEYGHELIFYGVPASNIPQGKLHKHIDPHLYYVVKRSVNAALKQKTLSRNIKYIDIYDLSNKKGPSAYIDNTHVRPEVFIEACQHYLLN